MLVLCTVLIDRPATAAVTLKLCETQSDECLATMPAACMVDGFTVTRDTQKPAGGYDFIILPVLTATPDGGDCSAAWAYDYGGSQCSFVICGK